MPVSDQALVEEGDDDDDEDDHEDIEEVVKEIAALRKVCKYVSVFHVV